MSIHGTRAPVARLHQVSGCTDPEREVDLVFVHGLDGHHESTWRHDKSAGAFWPKWIGDEMPSVGVWTLEYNSSSTRLLGLLTRLVSWRRASSVVLPLYPRAVQVLDLLTQNGFGARPIVFVGHSLGGLLAKAVVKASDFSEVPEKQKISRQVVGMLFLATPHFGSKGASVLDLLRLPLGATPVVEVLRWNQSQLWELNDWFVNRAPKIGITVRSYAESVPVGPILVVESLSAHPRVGEFAILDEDHISISKPRTKNDPVFLATTALVRLASSRRKVAAASGEGRTTGPEHSSTRRRIPREVPVRPVRLIGRQNELNLLVSRLRTRRLTAVVGPAGFGKSAVAAEALHEVVGDTEEGVLQSPFTDGIVSLDIVQTGANADRAWNGIANALAGPEFMAESSPSDRARESLRARSVLIVIENSEFADGNEGRTLVGDLLTVLSPQNSVLILTRDASQATQDDTVLIGSALTPTESEQLLRSIVGDAIDAVQLASLVEMLDGHPLALFLAGNAISSRTIPADELITSWRKEHVPSLRDQAGRSRAIEWLFERSLRGLTPDALVALRVFGELSSSAIEPSAVAACIESGDAGARAALRQLADRSLVRMVGASRFVCTHRLVHQFFKARAMDSPRLTVELAGYLREYLPTAVRERVEEASFERLNLLLAHSEAVLMNSVPAEAVLDYAQYLASELVVPQGYVGDTQYSSGMLRMLSRWLEAWQPQEAGDALRQWQWLSSCVLNAKCDLAVTRGNLSEALTNADASIAIASKMKSEAGLEGFRMLGLAIGRRGDLRYLQGRLADSRRDYSDAHREFDVALNKHQDEKCRLDLAMVSSRIGDLAFRSSAATQEERAVNMQIALDAYNASISQWQALLQGGEHDDDSVDAELRLAVAQAKAGAVLGAMGRLDDSLGMLRGSLDYLRAGENSSPNLPEWRRHRIHAERELAIVLRAKGDLEQAEGLQRSLIDDLRTLQATDSANSIWRSMAVESKCELGDTLLRRGENVSGEAILRQAQREISELCEEDPSNADWQRTRAAIEHTLARLSNPRT